MFKVFGKLISIVLCVLSIVLFVVGLATQDIGIMSLAAFSAWGMAFFAAMGEEERNIIYIFFLITFFIFLLSRVMVRWLENGEVYMPFHTDTMIMVYSCLTVSLFGLVAGTSLKQRIKIGNLGAKSSSEPTSLSAEESRINISLIRQLSGITTAISGFATLFVVLERIAFWSITGSGGELRVSFATTLPGIVLRFSYIYVMVFCVYLATLPDKRRCMPIIIQYLIVNALRMFYGSRMDFAVGLMFLLIYFVIRDRLNKNEESNREIWFGRPEKLFTVISIPVLIVILVFVGYYRRSTSFEFTGFFDTLADFFESQGTSINVIGYTDVYKDGFTQPKFLYLVDRTYEFFTANPISSLITGRHAYLSNTVERAQYGTSLGMTLYYHINQVSYLAGYGCGSSYIAEAWLGYGYVGLFFINFLLARIMKRLNEYSFHKFIPSVIALIYLQSLFFMPRGGFDSFVDDIASMTNIIAIFVLWILYKMVNGRNRKYS